MKTTLSLSPNKPAWIGLMLIFMPVIFWIAVIGEQLFNQGFLVENIIMPIDRISPLLSILFFIVFPFIAFLLNVFHIGRFAVFKENNEWVSLLAIRPNMLNFAIVIFSALNLVLLIAYSITENFIIIPR